MSITPTPDAWNADSVARKTFKGALALGVRQVLAQGANVLGGVLLARLLTPAEFGLFGIVVFLLGFLLIFGGTGLAANLIRQQEEPDESDYRAVFSVQQVAVVLLTFVFWLISPWLSAIYDLPASDAWIFRLVALSLLVTSFMVIPQVRLERNLDFDKLAAVEVSQALVFNATAVILAWQGLGGMSFALAVLFRAIIGALVANLVKPWPIRWRWDWPRARAHLNFGLYFQGGQFVSAIRESITPVFIGLFLGVAQAGYVTWAGMVAAYPVLVLIILQRVYVPAFARMQTHPEQLGNFVERVIWATNALVAPLAILTLILIEPLTRLVFGEKWLVALPLFYLLWMANLIVATATPLVGLLNALGKSRITFGLACLWMFSMWAFGLPAVYWLGVMGFAVANLLVLITGNIAVFYFAKESLTLNLFASAYPAWLAASLAGIILFSSLQFWEQPGIAICLASACGFAGVYLLALVFISGAEIQNIRQIISGRYGT